MDSPESSPAGPSRTSPAVASAASPQSEFSPTFERWRSRFAEVTGLGLSEAQKAERTQREEQAKLERDWERCQKWKEELMTRSPMVVFMLKHLRLSGCPFPDSAIQCHPCPDNRVGGFAPEYGILLCQNRFFSKKHMEDTLAHELIHAYDHCKFNVDWLNLRHHACTEIRAANLSGDCSWTREVKRGFYAFNKQHQACVKRRAVLSVIANPSCESQEMAEKVVNEVWESCSNDTRPFDEIY
ncbi:Mitochondrial inner membrane protease ATP23 [Saitozyma sp. JCM 24511]|nr:Mitochondrial inner membrane protease ATP23 [Saitozyma sp. JCM 24511]